MSDIDLYDSGEIAPYDPGMPVLAPLSPSPDTWGNTDVDLLREDHRQPQGPTLFGAAMPAGTTPQALQAVLGEIGGLYLSDFTKLNYPSALIQSSISFLMDNATKGVKQVTPRHNFTLPNELSNDWLAVLFANHLQQLAGTQAQKQQFLNASLAWLDKLNKRLNTQVTQAHGGAPLNSDPTENLTEAQYQQLVEHNNRVQAQTMATLERKWGACFKANIELAQAQLNKQTPAELAHLNRYTGSWPWTHMFNTVECLTAMFEMSIGANNIGVSSADINKEISQFEAMLKIPSERQKYMRDPQMQARLRELYQRRGS